MKSPYFIEIIRLTEGDDLPMMMDGKTRLPLFYPTVYITTNRRMNCSPQTQEKDLRNIMVLYTWALIRGIDIEETYLYGDFLSINEASDLMGDAEYYYEDLVKRLSASKKKSRRNTKIINLNDYLVLPKNSNLRTVGNNTYLSRILTISDYLEFFAKDRLHSLSRKNMDLHRFLSERRKDVTDYFTDNAPQSDKRSFFELPIGISVKDEQYIMQVVAYESDQNPWYNPIVKIRNEAIIKLMFELGMRRGEVLALKTVDINFKTDRLFIAKREDDPEDNRHIRPRQKTLERMHPMTPALSKLLRDYITKHRTVLRRGAVKKLDTDFVFVSVQDGKPINVKRISDIFVDIKKVPNIPQKLNSHTGRRNWNDRFSAICDKLRKTKKGITSHREQMYRNYFMGWTKNSDMGQRYSRRHTIQSAIDHQAKSSEEWFNSNIASSEAYGEAMERMRIKEDELEDIPF